MFPSQLIEQAVQEISRLPGIGKKTALRLVLHLLKSESKRTQALSESLMGLQEVKYCKQCHNISDGELCGLCSNPRRDRKTICIVEDFPDVIAIENTGQYQGLYHILGGIISPIDGIGPEDLHIESLMQRVANPEQPINEIILALSPTMEGDTTAFYLTKRMAELSLIVSTLARGVPIGGELEYTDEITLGRSILKRRAYETD